MFAQIRNQPSQLSQRVPVVKAGKRKRWRLSEPQAPGLVEQRAPSMNAGEMNVEASTLNQQPSDLQSLPLASSHFKAGDEL